MKNSDVYEKITNQVLEAIDKDNTLPWQKPWVNTGVSPMNYVSKKPYRGFNALITAFSGFKSPYWMTANQIKAAGGSWKGKGTIIAFWKVISKEVEDEKTKELVSKKTFLLRYYYVWNAEQISGIEFKEPDTPKLKDFGTIEAIENIINNRPNPCGLVHEEQDRAYYAPFNDCVTMPLKGQFKSLGAYYKTLSHELVHSTGHETRLSREGITKGWNKTKHDYSYEELVAELGAVFLMGTCGVNVEGDSFDNSITYLKGWRNRIAQDPKLIVSAAAHAQKAVDYIMGIEAPKYDDSEA